MDVVNPLYVWIAFAIAAILKLSKKQGEHAFSRALIAVWYFYVWMTPELTIESQRLVGRWVITQLAVLEILSFILRTWFVKQYNDAMRKL